MVIFGAIVGAVYLRLGIEDAHYELMLRQGFLKAALAMVVCLAAFYLFDLYDFIVMHDRRELVLRLVQALPKGLSSRHVAGQLVRSGTSVGSNYEEARGAGTVWIDD